MSHRQEKVIHRGTLRGFGLKGTLIPCMMFGVPRVKGRGF